jgi:CheY-like chemotaxis protein
MVNRLDSEALCHPLDAPGVLIADDDMNTRIMFSDYLTHEGYETIVTAGGEEALALAAVQLLKF